MTDAWAVRLARWVRERDQHALSPSILAWAALQRRQYREGRLRSDRVRALEATPGWEWRPTPGRKPTPTALAPPGPRFGDPDGHGRYGILDQQAGRLLCHECGGWWRQLATHARYRHGMTAAEYRVEHGLSPRARLVSDAVRQRLGQVWEHHRDDHLERLDATRDPARAFQASMSATGRPLTAQERAERQQRRHATRGRALTPDETARLGASTSVEEWAGVARSLMSLNGVSTSSIARATGLPLGTVSGRLYRFRQA